jgi:hypothetical protein
MFGVRAGICHDCEKPIAKGHALILIDRRVDGGFDFQAGFGGGDDESNFVYAFSVSLAKGDTPSARLPPLLRFISGRNGQGS